ncbi:MAG: class I SAM-dependent methyltransferase, partial [Bacteroidetes bacterium]|nr:class I SAM-dependent methyltransferase [Bacteroidota bacterium]
MQHHFDLDHIAFFTSALAAEIRAEYRKQTEKYADTLRIQTALRALWPDLFPSLLSACMTQFALQDRAAATLALPEGSLFTRDALEMASSAAVARLHASLLPENGRVLEIGAGVGADSAALADRAASLLCLESDPVHARLLRHNLSLLPGINATVLRGPAERLLPAIRLDRFDAVYADPARRSLSAGDGRRRSIRLEEYSPPFSLLDSLPDTLPVLVKVAPAAEAPANWSVAAVASAGECKELLLHRNLDLPARCA